MTPDLPKKTCVKKVNCSLNLNLHIFVTVSNFKHFLWSVLKCNTVSMQFENTLLIKAIFKSEKKRKIIMTKTGIIVTF